MELNTPSGLPEKTKPCINRLDFLARTAGVILGYGLTEAITIGIEIFLEKTPSLSYHTARSVSGFIAFVYAGLLIGLITYYIRVLIRRLRDIGWSKWWAFVLLVPLLNLLLVLFLFIIPTDFSWSQLYQKTKNHTAFNKTKIILLIGSIIWVAGISIWAFEGSYYLYSFYDSKVGHFQWDNFFLILCTRGILPIGLMWAGLYALRKYSITFKQHHKLCPYCTEKIKINAVRCKHCQSNIK